MLMQAKLINNFSEYLHHLPLWVALGYCKQLRILFGEGKCQVICGCRPGRIEGAVQCDDIAIQ